MTILKDKSNSGKSSYPTEEYKSLGFGWLIDTKFSGYFKINISLICCIPEFFAKIL